MTLKSIKELEAEGFSINFSAGYNQCREDIVELIDEWSNKVIDDWDIDDSDLPAWDKYVNELKQKIEGKT